MKKIKIREFEYEVIKDNGNCFDYDELIEKTTEYFDEYDYIFADYAYDKIRLKGFYDKDNKKVSSINSIECLEDYIKNYCAYGAKYFLLKKVK